MGFVVDPSVTQLGREEKVRLSRAVLCVCFGAFFVAFSSTDFSVVHF